VVRRAVAVFCSRRTSRRSRRRRSYIIQCVRIIMTGHRRSAVTVFGEKTKRRFPRPRVFTGALSSQKFPQTGREGYRHARERIKSLVAIFVYARRLTIFASGSDFKLFFFFIETAGQEKRPLSFLLNVKHNKYVISTKQTRTPRDLSVYAI